MIAAPLPFKIPVIVVERVIAGVVVLLATVPDKPLAETTETEVTVPVPETVLHVGAPLPLLVKTCPEVPAEVNA